MQKDQLRTLLGRANISNVNDDDLDEILGGQSSPTATESSVSMGFLEDSFAPSTTAGMSGFIDEGTPSEASDIMASNLSLPASAFSENLSVSSDEGYAGARHAPPPEQQWRTLQDYQERIHRLVRERDSLSQQYRHDVATLRAQLDAIRGSRNDQMAQVQEKLARLSAEIPVLRRRLAASKDDFEDLEVSPAYHAELRALPEASLSLREHILLRVADAVRAPAAQCEALRKELRTVRGALATATEQGGLETRQLGQALKLREGEVAACRRELQLASGREEELGRRLSQAVARAEEASAKAGAYDEERRRREAASVEAEGLRAREEASAEVMTAVKRERDEALQRASDFGRKLELLQVDKTYLSRELSVQQEQVARLEEALAGSKEKARAAKRAKSEYYEAMLTAREQARTKYEERLGSEVTRLREENAAELSAIREQGAVVYERENRSLREARDEAIEMASRAREQAASLQREVDVVRMEAAEAAAASEARCAELRSELRVKAYELERVGATLDEQTTALEGSRQEADMRRDKLGVMREEFRRLEAAAQRDAADASAQLRALREKVETYERLELELDGAIVAAGGAIAATGEGEGEGGKADGPGAAALSIAAVGSVAPTAARRRIAQSVHLARALAQAQSQASAAQEQAEAAAAEAAELRAALARSERLVERTSQPQAYLVDTIRQKERELAAAAASLQQLQQQLSEERAGRAQAEAALQQVLQERERVEALRLTVNRLARQATRSSSAAAAAAAPSSTAAATTAAATAAATPAAGAVSAAPSVVPHPTDGNPSHQQQRAPLYYPNSSGQQQRQPLPAGSNVVEQAGPTRSKQPQQQQRSLPRWYKKLR